MTRIYCIIAALLICSACSAPGPTETSSAPVNPHHVVSAAAANNEEPTGGLGVEAMTVLKKVPNSRAETGVSNLKLSYLDKAAFLADVQAIRPTQAIALDDIAVWEGFGPPLGYHTNKDGSITR